MAITVDWANTKVISIPRADMTLVQSSPTEIRQLDLNSFRLILRDLEDNPDGRPWPQTHTHNTTVEVGGVTLARVIEILEPYTITFEDGQYAVNLVGANSNVGDRVNVNQVSVRSANSAGLVDLEILIASAYQGHVVFGPSTGQAGTDEPIGTFKIPSQNEADTLAIAVKQGVRDIIFLESITLTGDYSLGYNFIGVSKFVEITLAPEGDFTGCSMFNLTVPVGEMDGLNTCRDISVGDVTKVSGFFERVSFTGTVVQNGKLNAYDCYSQVEGAGHPHIDVGVHGLAMRNLRGSMSVINAQVGHVSSIGLSEGRLLVGASCVGGEIHKRGTPFRCDDSSGPLCNVIDETESEKVSDIHGQVQRAVYIDTELADIGDGYQQTPYNNWTSGVDYAEERGLKILRVLSDADVDRQLKNFTIEGLGLPTIDLADHIMDNSIFRLCGLTGGYSGVINAIECALINLSGLNGVFFTVNASGTLTVGPAGSATLWNVTPAVAGEAWTISMNGGVKSTCAIHKCSGEFNVINMDHVNDLLDINSDNGRATIAASCLEGEIRVSGDIKIVDNSGPNCTVTFVDTNSEILLDSIA